jgi:hypothetical protein
MTCLRKVPVSKNADMVQTKSSTADTGADTPEFVFSAVDSNGVPNVAPRMGG